MAQTREAIEPNVAERVWWQAARRDDARVARRLSRKQVVDGVDQVDAEALLDALCYFLPALGVGDWLGEVQGPAVQREMVPFVPYVLRSSLKTLCGIERMPALPAVRFRDEALMRLVGFNAHQVRHGVCQRGAAHRQGARPTGPICPEALADNSVKLHLRDLEALFNRVIRALAQAGVVAAKVTGIVDATEVETTAPYEGGGQVTRTRQSTDTRGQVQEIEVTVDGWKLRVLLEARTKIPLAATLVLIQEHETRSLRALITQARTKLAGHVRLHKVVFDQGLLAGVDLWWLAQHGLTLVVPAKAKMAVTMDAQAQAAAGEGLTVGRRAHTVRPGQGKTAWSERLETAVVGITGVTTYDQDGTPAPGRHPNRRDVQPNPITAVVVRQWHGRNDGPGGKTVFLTNAPVDQPLQPFADDDERRRIENGDSKERTPQWSLKHPPQKTARAVHVHVRFTLLMFALATAYRLPAEQDDLGPEPVGWQRWRRQLLEQRRDHVIGFARDCEGIVHLAAYALLRGVRLKDVPPGRGTPQDILATSRLPAHG